MEYRHELKFRLSENQMHIIERRIKPFLQQDSYQEGDYYTITSVYFDDIYNSNLRENIQGYDPRSKYRIRIYNHNFEQIKLEKKEKISGMTKKTTTTLSREEAYQVINNPYFSVITDDEVKKRLLTEIKIKGLKPVSIVEYDRSVYIYRVGNVRITFDRNIRASTNINNFWCQDTFAIPLLQENVHILEVKYDEFLPQFIYDILDIGILQRSNYSKYAESRKYDT